MIYTKVKKICKEKGISIRAVEIKAGLGNGTISNWDNVSPNVDNVKAVAKALGVKISSLLD